MDKLRSQAELAAEILAARAKEKRRVVATAESLTGGLVSELITGVAGRPPGSTAGSSPISLKPRSK